MTIDDSRYMDDFLRSIVDREVRYCVSGLISTLAHAQADAVDDDLAALIGGAWQLAASVPDYEEACINALWERGVNLMIDEQTVQVFRRNFDDNDYSYAESWEELAAEQEIEPVYCKVHEHWVVTEWLGRRLEEVGEKVDFDFAGMTVWARTTADQAIYMDPCIRTIGQRLRRKSDQ